MNLACAANKSTDSGYSLHDSIGSDDYENDSDGSASYSCNGDLSDYRQLATIIVDNLLTKAISKASEEVSHIRELHIDTKPKFNETDLECFPPAIQIDLVGSKTPSPEEEQFDWSAPVKQYKFKHSIDQQSTSIDTDFSVNDFEVSEKDDDSIYKNSMHEPSKNIPLNEVQAFAKEYVQYIITSALETAELHTTQASAKTTIAGEGTSLLRSSRSDNQGFVPTTWYTRLRQVFTRLMRSACLCKSKEQFRQRKT